MQHNNSWAARNCRKASSSQSLVAIASTVECGCYNFWGSYVWYNNINVVADAAVGGGGGAGAFGQLTVDRVRTQGDKKSQTEVQSLTRHLLKLKSFSNHQTKRIKLNVTRPHTLQYFSSELKRKREYDAAGLCTCWISKCFCVCVQWASERAQIPAMYVYHLLSLMRQHHWNAKVLPSRALPRSLFGYR